MTTISVEFPQSHGNVIERLVTSIGVGLLVWANSRARRVTVLDEHEQQILRVQVATGIREREHAALRRMRFPQ